MKKALKKIFALCLCALLAVSAVVLTASAVTSGPNEPDGESKMPAAVRETEAAAAKDETVYVFAGADGSVQKIIVSDWLKNTSGSQTLNDQTDLSEVENVRGEESYTPGSDGACVWDAQGHDIYYQGTIDRELPVNLSVTYKLNGDDISPDELAGKSGRVTMRFDYRNQQYEYVEINGQKEKIYVPFVVLTGVLLDHDVFTNIEVSGGKLINDGSRTAVIGIAFPGLQENLGIDREQFEIPDYVEITADAQNFALGMTVTYASNELFREFEPDKFDLAGGLNAPMEKLTEAMDQLLDGASQLSAGLSELLDKSGVLTEGADQLLDGAAALKGGAESLNGGAAALQSGASQLSGGLNTLASNNDSLNGGAAQVFETLLSAANTQLAAAGLEVPPLTIGNYADVLNGVIASLDEKNVYEKALAAVTAAVEGKRSYIEEQVTAAVRAEVAAQVTAAVREQVAAQVAQAVRDIVREQVIQSVLHMDTASYEAAVAAGMIDKDSQAAVEAAVEQQMQSGPVQQQIQSQTEEQMASQPVQETITAKTAGQMKGEAVQKTIAENVEQQVQTAISDNMASDEVKEQLAAAAQGARSVMELKSSLDRYQSFYSGLQTYTAGVAEAAAGAAALQSGTGDLQSGTAQLAAGASELYGGILTLKNSLPALIDGITQLRNGAEQLSDGLHEFNGEGIQKLIDAVNGDLAGLEARLRAAGEVSRNYKTFAGAADETDGQVRFLYRTDAIE